MRLAQKYEEAFKEIVRLQAGKSTVKSKDVKETIATAIGLPLPPTKGEERAKIEDEDAKVAITAFADEIGKKLFGSDWDNPGSKVFDLSYRLGVTHPGTEFYVRRDAVAKRHTPYSMEVLEIYAQCMMLGFKGKPTEAVKDIIQRTLDEACPDRSAPSDLLAGRDQLAKGGRSQGRQGFTPGVLLLVLAALLYILAFVHLTNHFGELRLPSTLRGQ